jgi:hypothetical protein
MICSIVNTTLALNFKLFTEKSLDIYYGGPCES